MTLSLVVARAVGDELVHVGTITRTERGVPEVFVYASSYLERGDACPLSLSLPLSAKAFESREMRPYFEGLLPEGPMREALVSQIGLPADDYLALLAAVGLDCIGDVVIHPSDGCGDTQTVAWDGGTYDPMSSEDMGSSLLDLASLARSNGKSRLSLAGTQGKVGLAHLPGASLRDGWMRPMGGAASTHILKTSNLARIAEFEIVCMQAARACGVRVARTDVLSFDRPVACVERYDRVAMLEGKSLRVERLHQEDLSQAFGVGAQAKYLDLEGGTYRSAARLLEDLSTDPLGDIDQLARIAIFDYLVGNCDNHLKNLSVLHEGRHVRLAPAYDVVCTTFFERFSREMGRRLGSTRSIDDVCPSDLALLSKDLGMGVRRMRKICSSLAEPFGEALLRAGEDGADVIETLPYSAEDVLEDARPRLDVVGSFASGAGG